MSKVNRARTATAKAAPATRRINLRALIVLGAIVVAAVPALIALKLLQSNRTANAYLAEARKAQGEGRLDMALSFLNGHLQNHPDDLEALDLKGEILLTVARDPQAIDEAVNVQRQILAKNPNRLSARKRLVELNLKSGYYRAAEAAASEYLTKRPDDAEGHRLMARAKEGIAFLGEEKALDDAITHYEAAETREPGDILGAVRLAVLYRQRANKRDQAIGVLDRMVALNPKKVMARLARYQFFLGDPGKDAGARAAAELEEAIRLGPKDADARITAAESEAKRGDTAAARAHLAAIDPPLKNDLRIQLVTGLIELQDRHPDEAIQSWRAGLIQTGGTNAELTFRLALVLLRMGRVAEAKPLMTQYRRLVGGGDPKVEDDKDDRPEYRYLVALARLRQGQPSDAIARLEAIRDKIGNELKAQHLITLGSAYEAVRDDAKAADCYRRAQPLVGTGSLPWISLARLQLATQPAEAISTLERGLAANPDDPALLVMLAQVLWQQEANKPADGRDWAGFTARLAAAEAAAPGSAEVAALRADYLALIGRLDEALAAVQKATEKTPRSVALWLSRAQALTRLGRLDEARDVLVAGTRAAGDDSSLRTARSRLYAQLDEPKKALAVLVEGLGKVPSDQKTLLWHAIGDFHRERNDPVQARRAYEEWAKLQPDSPEPRLALFNLEMTSGDGPAIEAQVEALKRIGGAASIFWKIARAEMLLRPRPADAGPADAGDQAKLAEAQALIAELKAATPMQPVPYLLEGRLLERLDKTDKAIDAYRTALGYRGGQAALQPLVVLLSRQQRVEEIEELKRQVAQFPMVLDKMVNAIIIQRGDADKAEEMAKRIAQGNPADLDSAVWRARVLNTLGKPREAEDALKVMAQQRPDDAAPWLQLLMFQVAQREMDAARSTLGTMMKRVKAERPELLWATCYRILGLNNLAEEQYKLALARWPDDVKVLQSVVDYEESVGHPELAEAHLRHLIEVRDDFEWARRRLALNLSSRPNDPAAWSEAMKLVAQVSDGLGESPDDRLLRAIILSRSIEPRNRDQAIVILEELSSELPNSSKLHEVLARSYLTAGDRAKARQHASRAVATEAAATAEVVLFYAGIVLEDGDLPEAERQLAKLREIDKASMATVELDARILHAKGDDAEAVRRLREAFEARKATPTAIGVGTGIIRILAALKLNDAADSIGKEVAAVDFRGKLVYAELLKTLGKTAEARDLVKAAYNAGGQTEAIRTSLALAGLPGSATDEWLVQTDGLLRLALKAQPDSIDLLQAQAYLLHLQGKYEEEVALYEKILARKPSGSLMNNQAWTLSEELNRPAEGLAKINQVIDKSGRQPHLMDTRGVILTRLGRYDEAIRDLEDASSALPSPALYYHMARAYKKAGREADFARLRDLAVKSGLKPDQLQSSERPEATRLLELPGPSASR